MKFLNTYGGDAYNKSNTRSSVIERNGDLLFRIGDAMKHAI